MDQLPPDHFVTSSAYTPHVYRDQYSAIDPTSSALSQAGKVVVITGASAGIGARGFAPAFAKAGPKAIVLVGRDADKLKSTEDSLKKINAQVEVLASATDLTSPSSVSELFSKIKSSFGMVDVLVNNAGSFVSNGIIGEADASQWWQDFEVNVKGTFLVTKAFLNLLGKDKPGSIINMSTSMATSVYPTLSAYSISKLSILRLSESIAAEYPNVTSVAMQPGVVLTDMVIDTFKRFAQDTPELVGGTGVWLATDNARFLSGRFISANWSVDDLLNKKDEILAGNDLKMVYQGKFGLGQFQQTGI